MVITLSGVIGSGKSTLATILGNQLGTDVYYESVEDNPMLPLFYKDPQRYSFELQIYFLSKRLDSIMNALSENNSVLDRSIYEDSLFFHVNARLGRVADNAKDAAVLVELYDNLLEHMMRKVHGMPKMSPDLMIGIHVSYDTMINRISKRGRDYEQINNDSSLKPYYKELLIEYDKFFNSIYKESPIYVIDGDKYDFVENIEDRKIVLNDIKQAMIDNGIDISNTTLGSSISDNKLDVMLNRVKEIIV